MKGNKNMDEKIVNIYYNEPVLPSTTMFHFMYSLRPFIMAEGPKNGQIIIVDITMGIAYSLDELSDDSADFHFYGADGEERNDDDDEFYGVAVIGEIW